MASMFPILDFVKYQKTGDKTSGKNLLDFAKKGLGLAGLDTAKGMGFTHTNPAKTSFEDEEAKNLGSPDSAIKETK
jgi:hypothetical protein